MMKNLVVDGSQGEDPLRLLGRMTAGVLHDLDNYLCVIGVLIERLAAAPTAEHRSEARRALGHASALTRSVLDYMRGAAPELGPVDLSAIVRDVMQIAARAISSTIEVVVVGVDAIALVRGTIPQLGQLVLNLALNAADAMLDGGILSVTVWTTPEGSVRLDVADTGGGITIAGATQRGSMWTESTKCGRATGRGLGLGVVREVAHLHGATFTLATFEQGVTLATVVFPHLDDPPSVSS
jgi:signal transduction histidine kinase